VVIYPASGTGAREAALVNTLSPGDAGGGVAAAMQSLQQSLPGAADQQAA
jgi:aspartate aminotransferase-like enzyme